MASVSTRSCQGPELARPYGAHSVAELDFTSLVTASAMMASFSGYKPTQLEELTEPGAMLKVLGPGSVADGPPFSSKRAPSGPRRVVLTFQAIVMRLKAYWASQGCIVQEPLDCEVGAGTMCPETFLRVLGPDPYRVAYVQPSRRPADGRYGENPNRLYKHMQLQVILKPAPEDVVELYLKSLEEIGIDLSRHDLKLEEDNWESPTLGAWGVGWQVMLDGLEITQFTYFQQCGGLDLEVVPAELTYGLERLAAFIQDVESVYDIRWNDHWTYADVRLADEQQYSAYNFEVADIDFVWREFELHEAECQRLLAKYAEERESPSRRRFPLLAAFDQTLKCSHLFNTLQARGAISVTERARVIQRVRTLAVGVANAWVDQRMAMTKAQHE